MINKVILTGRMVKDPELKVTQSGTAVCTFRIAVDRRFKNENGEKVADFFTVVAWKGTAEFVGSYCPKGRLIAVDGRLQTRQWQDQSGQNRSVVEVVAESVDALGPAKSGDETEDGTPEGLKKMGAYRVENVGDYDPFANE